jgi:hemerythrin
MDFETPRDRSDRPDLKPIDKLEHEHSLFIAGLDELSAAAGHDSAEKVEGKVVRFAKRLERHQETEERFLFPLVVALGEGTIAVFRDEHKHLLEATDKLAALARSGDAGAVAGQLDSFRSWLESHFSREEAEVFGNTGGLLSAAQTDILRMKIVKRKDPQS